MTTIFEYDQEGRPVQAGDRFATPVVSHNDPKPGDQIATLVLDEKAKKGLELVRDLADFWYTGCMEFDDPLAELREWKMFGMWAHRLLYAELLKEI